MALPLRLEDRKHSPAGWNWKIFFFNIDSENVGVIQEGMMPIRPGDQRSNDMPMRPPQGDARRDQI